MKYGEIVFLFHTKEKKLYQNFLMGLMLTTNVVALSVGHMNRPKAKVKLRILSEVSEKVSEFGGLRARPMRSGIE